MTCAHFYAAAALFLVAVSHAEPLTIYFPGDDGKPLLNREPRPSQCGPGYLIDSNGRCLDIDECLGVTNPCNAGYTCVNTPGSYNCEKVISTGPASLPKPISPPTRYPQCNAGYRYDAQQNRCIDVDECATGQHNCGLNTNCVNYDGGFTCFCNSGFRLNRVTNRCEDINECEEQKNLCLGHCQNTPGSYTCGCPKGFVLDKDGRYCIDIDECATNKNVCQGNICQNIHGDYRCHKIDCPAGYTKQYSDTTEFTTCTRVKNCHRNDHACISTPYGISYFLMTLPHAIALPSGGHEMFTLDYVRTVPGSTSRFTFNLARVNASKGVVAATVKHFSLKISGDRAIVILNRSLGGPQEVEFEIVMSTYDSNGVLFNVNLTKVLLVISEFGNPILRP